MFVGTDTWIAEVIEHCIIVCPKLLLLEMTDRTVYRDR